MYGQQFVRQMSSRFSIDPAEKTEPICSIQISVFTEQLIIEDEKKTILNAKAEKND